MPAEGGMKQILTTGKVKLADLMSADTRAPASGLHEKRHAASGLTKPH